MPHADIHSAFRDAPHESQTVFRAAMQAMARPGSINVLHTGFEPPAPLLATSAAILLALADFETPVWLDAQLSTNSQVRDFLRFHTGAKLIATPSEANFALIADARHASPLSAFAQGTPDYPDRSTTLIMQVSALQNDGWQLAGPGIQERTAFHASPLPDDFVHQLGDNRARFPLGVDVIFASETAIAALPRSTRIVEER